MNFADLLPTFSIALREGFEAVLIVGLVLACLRQAGQSHLNRWVGLGIVVGLGLSALVGVGLAGVFGALDRSAAPLAPLLTVLLKVTLGTLAIGLLSWMLVWMTQQSKQLKGEVQSSVQQAIGNGDGAGWKIFSLVTAAVLQEGLETVIFIAAQFQQSVGAAVGAVSGLAGAVLMGLLLFRFGVRIDVRRFFQVVGVLLLLVVAGLVVSVLKQLDAAVLLLSAANPAWAGLCTTATETCVLGPRLWDLSAVLNDHQLPGVLLKTLLGYRDRLYLAQGIGYSAFLSIVGTLYFRSLAQRALPSADRPAVPPADGSPRPSA
jgi:high-affinity iron transporter